MNTPTPTPKKRYPKRGFASIPIGKRRAIASMGGKTAHRKGVAYEWTSEQAREAGRKGGLMQAARKRQAQDELKQLVAQAMEETQSTELHDEMRYAITGER